MKYWLYSDGNILGPYEPAELLAAPDFTEESLVCDENSINAGRDDWKPASQFPEFAEIMTAAQTGAAMPEQGNSYPTPDSDTAAAESPIPSSTDSNIAESPDVIAQPEIINAETVPQENAISSVEETESALIAEEIRTEILSDGKLPEPAIENNFGETEAKSADVPSDSPVSEQETTKPEPVISSGISDLEKILNSKEFSLDSFQISDLDKKDDIVRTDEGPEENTTAAEIVGGSDTPEKKNSTDNVQEAETIENAEIADSHESDNKSDDISQSVKTETAQEIPSEKPSDKSSFAEVATDNDSKEPSLDEFLSSLDNILGVEKEDTIGADRPPKSVSDFKKEISDELESKRNVKEELDSVRLEKDFLLGQLSLHEMGQSDRKKRIDDLIQTLRSKAHQQGGKSVFDEDMPTPQEAAQQSLPLKEETPKQEEKADKQTAAKADDNFEEGFVKESGNTGKTKQEDIVPAQETEKKAESVSKDKPATSSSSRIQGSNVYNVSEDGGRPPVYYYENSRPVEKEKDESIAKISLADDFRTGQIDFSYGNEDEVFNLLPQQAGGMVYDFTTLAGKPAKVSTGRRTVAQPVSAKLSVSTEEKSSRRSNSEIKAAISRKTVSQSEDRKVDQKSGKEKEENISLSGIKSSALARSNRRRSMEVSERERQRSSRSEGPLLQEISEVRPAKNTGADKKTDVSDLASMSDEDRIRQETYEAILAGKDPTLFANNETSDEQTVSLEWDQAFDAGSLLQAASIENIGKDRQQTVSFNNASDNPFQAADIYSTPQQNVLADEIFPEGQVSDTDSQDVLADSFLDILPADQEGGQDGLDTFADYYVDSVPGESVYANSGNSADNGFDAYITNDAEQGQSEVVETGEDAEVKADSEEKSGRKSKRDKGPKIVKGIPASLSSIHRSIRTTRRKTEEQQKDSSSEDNDWDNMPDFNVQLSPLESTHAKISGIRSSDDSARIIPSAKKIDSDNSEQEEDTIPALELNIPSKGNDDNKESVSSAEDEPPALELNIPGKEEKQEKTAKIEPIIPEPAEKDPALSIEPAVIPAVQYFDPEEPKSSVVKTVSVPVDSGVASIAEPQSRTVSGGTLSKVLKPIADKPEKNTGVESSVVRTEEKPKKGGRKMLVLVMLLMCVVMGALALFMLGGNKAGSGKETNVASATPAEPNPITGNDEEEDSSSASKAEEAAPVAPVADSKQEEGDIATKEEIPARPQPEEEVRKDENAGKDTESKPALDSLSKEDRAIAIVKDYRLSGGRGTINNWFSNAFLSTTPLTGNEWKCTPLHEDIYVVAFQLPRSRQDPLYYQFEVDLASNTLLRGINNNAIDLLELGNTKTARAVPARDTYDSDTPRQVAKKDTPSSGSSVAAKPKNKVAPRKTYKKEPVIRQLPLPPAPKRKYSQSVPTGFEQPEEDSNEAFLKAMESDEELF